MVFSQNFKCKYDNVPILVLMVWQIRLECLSLAVFLVSLVFRVRPLSNVIKKFTAVSYEFS
jgi:hypothetical protein